MARYRATLGEDHRPGNLSRPAIEFTIDEISDSAQTKPNRGGHDKKVGYFPEGFFVLPGEKKGNEQQADQSSVKGHPAVPDGQDLKGVIQVGFKVVEENIAE